MFKTILLLLFFEYRNIPVTCLELANCNLEPPQKELKSSTWFYREAGRPQAPAQCTKSQRKSPTSSAGSPYLLISYLLLSPLITPSSSAQGNRALTITLQAKALDLKANHSKCTYKRQILLSNSDHIIMTMLLVSLYHHVYFFC